MASSSREQGYRGGTIVERLTVMDYLKKPESMRPTELVYGFVREPPAPRYGHQSLLTHLGALLDLHVRERQLGQVCVSPVDIVLDEAAGLVVQPDLVFVGRERLAFVRDRVFGPPDLAIEILSPGTAKRDRTTKLGWYRQYGVRECWLVDAVKHALEVFELQAGAETRQTFADAAILRSVVLPEWAIPVREIFD